jgi:hypothetical protein
LVRVAVLIVGAVILLIALWRLLADAGVTPSASDVAAVIPAGRVAGAAAKVV